MSWSYVNCQTLDLTVWNTICPYDSLWVEINSVSTINGWSCVAPCTLLWKKVGCSHNATSSHKFPAEGESERRRGLSLYLRMINPPSTATLRITEEPWADLSSSEKQGEWGSCPLAGYRCHSSFGWRFTQPWKRDPGNTALSVFEM